MAREHTLRGGHSSVIVRRGLAHEARGSRLLAVDMHKVTLSRLERRADVALARVGLRRRCFGRMIEPAIEAVPPTFEGPVVLVNSPAAVFELRRLRPRAKPCLWVQNYLWRTFGRRERARLVESAHAIFIVNTPIRDGLLRRIRDHRGACAVLLNGVDPVDFHPRAAPDRENGDDLPVVLFVGRTTRVKGPHLLVRAAARLHAQGHGFRLRIVGSAAMCDNPRLTPYERRLRRAARPLGDRVEFVDFVDRRGIADAYRRADIFCVPSVWHEPCALVLLEGMASGLACVAAQRGGLPEVGLEAIRYFDVRRPRTLVRALADLLADRDERARAGDRARARAEELSWSDRYEAVVRHLEGLDQRIDHADEPEPTEPARRAGVARTAGHDG